MRYPKLLILYLLINGAPVWGAQTDLSSILEFNSAYAPERGDWQKNELIWRPTLVTRFDTGSKLTLNLEVRNDIEDQIDPGSPDQPFRAGMTRKSFPSDESELELRELFLDHYLGDAFLRVGKQQIVWGQADGLRVLDVINPLSYREFILPDIEYRRIPLWSAMLEVPFQSGTAQFVWVPDATVTESTLPGATYSLIPDPFDGTGRLVVNRPESFTDGDYGFRFSSFQNGWDLTANYLYHTVDDPLIRVDPSLLLLEADYNRSHLFGFTASKPFGDFTLRSEVGFETQKRISDPSSSVVFESEEVSYVIGVDYSGLSDTLLSAQLFQSHRPDVHGELDSTIEQMTLLMRRDFLNNTVNVEALAIFDNQNKDSLLQISSEYTLATNVVLHGGVDYFFGDNQGQFGRFRDESRVELGVKFSF
ncbi:MULTISPECIES: DUF1302 family protein [unclassified Marinobacter]|jgi:hypothetical protein|uniref:DUF1302 family protein n=1 Tax=unclassified Marinobacter TaxID=83889 RepID=UPI0019272847|nr:MULTISPECIES: DUF1302 family protein [unclassified Marinobacter]MBL3827174.1 hypothetical protein [Marinobacter sp. MC3]MBL3895736.1 hypothetical protein [Marinobacter sp. MW3]